MSRRRVGEPPIRYVLVNDRRPLVWAAGLANVEIHPFPASGVISIKNVCVHKGLFPLFAEQRLPRLREYASVGGVSKAAKD